MALFGRNKRYNTLDLASKIVCRRRTPGPPSETSRIPAAAFPLVGQKCFLPVFIFPRFPQKQKGVFAEAGKDGMSIL
jgi:hypothetical protein